MTTENMSSTNIEGHVVLTGEEAASVIRQLNDRIKQLERQVAFEREHASERAVQSVPDVIKYLRLHGVVLLNVGDKCADDIAAQIAEESESAAAVAALNQAWNLADAPLPQAVIGEVRAAIRSGSCRW